MVKLVLSARLGGHHAAHEGGDPLAIIRNKQLDDLMSHGAAPQYGRFFTFRRRECGVALVRA